MNHKSLLSALISVIFGQFLAAPIDYDGTSQVTLNTYGDWSAKFGVGSNCDGDSTIELTIDITRVSTEADLILGFGTETNYFAVFNPYDGAMCVPCDGNKQTGNLFVTPPRGAALRSPDAGKTTTTQYGATTDILGARVALVNSGDQATQWDMIIGIGRPDIGLNKSPITLTIVQDTSAGTTTLTVNKNSVTSPDIEFTSTFTSGDDLFLFLGIDDAGTQWGETFQLNGVEITQNQCNPAECDACDNKAEIIEINDRIDSLINQLNYLKSISAAHSSVFNQNNQIKDDGNATYLLSNTGLLMVSLVILTIFINIINICICWRNGSFGGNKKSIHKYSKVNIASNSDIENLK